MASRSLVEYQSPSEDDKKILALIELHLKEVELLILRNSKSDVFRKHALIRLFEAGIMAKECVKRELTFLED
jgi:hypothetical protein